MRAAGLAGSDSMRRMTIQPPVACQRTGRRRKREAHEPEEAGEGQTFASRSRPIHDAESVTPLPTLLFDAGAESSGQ